MSEFLFYMPCTSMHFFVFSRIMFTLKFKKDKKIFQI